MMMLLDDDMPSNGYLVTDVNGLADQLLQNSHLERDEITRLEDMDTFQRFREICKISKMRQDKLYKAHERPEIEAYWLRLKATANASSKKLKESISLHYFMDDFSELVSQINNMKALISTNELTKDVADADALMKCYEKHKGEIDAIEDKFKALTESGQQLLNNDHYANNIKEKLSMLDLDKKSLIALWEERYYMILYKNRYETDLINKQQLVDFKEFIQVEEAVDRMLKQTTIKKSLKPKEANKEKSIITILNDCDSWKREFESLITSKDARKDLTFLRNVVKKYELLEADLASLGLYGVCLPDRLIFAEYIYTLLDSTLKLQQPKQDDFITKVFKLFKIR